MSKGAPQNNKQGASKKQASAANYNNWWVGVAAMSLTIGNVKDWNWLAVVAWITEVGSLFHTGITLTKKEYL